MKKVKLSKDEKTLEEKKGSGSESRRGRKKSRREREGRGASVIYRRPVLTRRSSEREKSTFFLIFFLNVIF